MIRERLGESLASVQKHDVALEQSTTSSLEALQAYTAALKTWDEKGDEASVPFFRRAVELDPKFAMAYAALGTIYHNLKEDDQANVNIGKAYGLRDRVTEYERFSIESRYYRYVTGEFDRAADVYEMADRSFPGTASTHTNLGALHGSLGHPEKAVEEFREALRLDPTRGASHGNLALGLITLNRFDEAERTVAAAAERNLHSEALLEAAYGLAFLRGDAVAMQRLIEQASDSGDTESLFLDLQAMSEAYIGHLRNSRELTRRAAATALHAGDKELAASILDQAALREADLGTRMWARRDVAEATSLASSRDAQIVACLALARAGEMARSQAMVTTFKQKYPADTLMQGYWLPSINAAVELERAHPAAALRALDPASAYQTGGACALRDGATVSSVPARGVLSHES